MNRRNVLAVVMTLIAACAAARAQSFEDQLGAAARAALKPVASDPYLAKTAVRSELKAARCGPTQAELSSLFGKLRGVPGTQVALIRAQDPKADDSCGLLLLARVLPDALPKLQAALPGSNAISDPEYAAMVEDAVKFGRLAAFGSNREYLNRLVRDFSFIPRPSALPASIVGRQWECSQKDWSSDMDGDHEFTRTWTFRLNADHSVDPPFVPAYNQGRQDRFYLISGKTVYFFYAGAEGIYRDLGYDSQEFTSASAAKLAGPYGLACRTR